MSPFYRPTGPFPAAVSLWSRCDMCFHSGPFNEFDIWTRDGQADIYLCQLCVFDVGVIDGLVRCGWQHAG